MSKIPVNLKSSKGAGVIHNQAIVANEFVYCSGQLPADLATGELIAGDIKENVHKCIQNLKTVLEEAGSDLEYAVKVNIFLTDMKHLAAVNEVYVQYWGDIKPVRTCVGVQSLPRGGDVEIECTALLKPKAHL